MTDRYTPGFYIAMPADEYHADPSVDISLSRSIAETILDRCARAAWHDHPRLNPQFDHDKPDNDMLIGSAAHKIVLGAGADIHVVEAKDWRTKEAQTQKEQALATGKIPVTRPQFDRAEAMSRVALASAPEHAFNTEFGVCEICVIATDPTGATLRTLIDFYANKNETGLQIWDYKTTMASANPVFAKGLMETRAFQHAFTERCVVNAKPELAGKIKFRNFVQEQKAPYLCVVIEPTEEAMTVARKQVAAAIGVWQRCISENKWPGYPSGINRVGITGAAEQIWIMREMEEFSDIIQADPFLSKVM
jgi:hypothetical protein